jgi:hypothetical protein
MAMSDDQLRINRRQFLSTSVSCLLASGLAGLAPATALAQAADEKKTSNGKLITRTLGRTGMELPIVSMGTGATNSPSVVKAAYEVGVRHFDTAANYAYGRNEQMIGNVIHKLGVRGAAAARGS